MGQYFGKNVFVNMEKELKRLYVRVSITKDDYKFLRFLDAFSSKKRIILSLPIEVYPFNFDNAPEFLNKIFEHFNSLGVDCVLEKVLFVKTEDIDPNWNFKQLSNKIKKVYVYSIKAKNKVFLGRGYIRCANKFVVICQSVENYLRSCRKFNEKEAG